jgi:hypothetical protein
MDKQLSDVRQEPESIITLVFSHELPATVVARFGVDLRRNTPDVSVFYREKPPPRASLDLLIATPLVWWFAEKYLGLR